MTSSSRHAAAPGLSLLTLLGRHLRDRMPLVLIGVVVAVLTGLLTAGARAEGRAADQALGVAVRSAEPGLRDISLSLSSEGMAFEEVPATDDGEASAPFGVVDKVARELMGSRVASVVGSLQVSAQSDYFPISRLTGESFADFPIAALRVQPGLGEHVTWVSGGPPGASTTTVPLRDRNGDRTVAVIPVALSQEFAQRFGVSVGDRLRLDPDSTSDVNGVALRSVAVAVTGIYRAKNQSEDFWSPEPGMHSVGAIPGPDGGAIPISVVVVGEEGYSALSGALAPWATGVPSAVMSTSAFGMTHVWRYVLDPDELRASDPEELKAALVRLGNTTGPWPASVGVIRLSSGLSTVVNEYQGAVRTTAVMNSFALAGLFVLGVLGLALTSAVLVQRRAPALHLLGVRGVSGVQVGALLAGEAGLVSIPAALIGWGTARLSVSGPANGRIPWDVIAMALAPVLVTATLSVAAAHRGREWAARPMLWRTAAEILLVAVTAFAIATALTRGGQSAQGDLTLAALPALLALSATVIVLRLAAPVLALAGKVAAQGVGFRAMLGLRRAASGLSGSALAVATVAVAVALATFLGSAANELADLARRTAYRSVGADVRVDAQRIDEPEISSLRTRAGVTDVVAAYAAPRQVALVGDGVDPRRVTVQLMATATGDYQRMLQGTELAFTSGPPSAARGKVVPVVVSGGLVLGEAGVLRIDGSEVRFEVVGVEPALDRSTDSNAAPTMLASLAAMRSVSAVIQPNVALLQTSSATAESLASQEPTALTTAVVSRRAMEATLSANPLTTLIRASAAVGGVVAAGLTLVGILLLLTLTRPARMELLLRLRTMGVEPRRDRVIGVIETLPGVLLAIAVGLATAVVAPRIVSSAFNLGPLVGAPPVTLTVPPVLAGVVALAAVDLALLALLIDARQAARSDLAQALRRGDRA